jgi:putative sugar O-methyltransferase
VTTTIDDLNRIYRRVQAAIERNMAASSMTAAGQVSAFWAEVIADRKNFPELNEIMTFRRDGFAYGIGDDRQGTLAQEREYYRRMHYIFRRMVPTEFIEKLPETSFGAPFVFEHDGVHRSASFWINAATTARVKEFVERFGRPGPLRILEIGSGWGACAYQLHHVLDVESYTLVDLPQNLQICAIHLATTLPRRQLEFVEVVGPPIAVPQPHTIAACLPGALDRLHGKYDLVLNSFSLQEMTIEAVQAYINWIRESLSEDGIFVSFNSHAKAGVREPADYRYDTFHIHHWDVFRLSPSGYCNTIPYEVVLGRRSPQSPRVSPEAQNGLGWLMQLGLDSDLRPLSKALLRGDDTALLPRFGRVFLAETDCDRNAALDDVSKEDVTPISPFVAAHLALVQGDNKSAHAMMQEARRRGLSGFAMIRAQVMLTGLARLSGQPISLEIDGFDAAFAYPEVAAIVQTGDLTPMIYQTNRIFRRTQS